MTSKMEVLNAVHKINFHREPVTLSIDYSDWDEAVHAYFPWLYDYEIVPDEELNNDSSYVVDVDINSKYDSHDYEGILKGEVSYNTDTIANMLALIGVIPEKCKLIIKVSY